MTFLKSSHDGYLMVDHRASPGIPEDKARQMGFDPKSVAEGKVFEAPTLGCPHCGSHVVLNPLRTRARGHCMKCNRYICDGCVAVMRDPDYVHRTVAELAELIGSGRYELSGSLMRPVLKPKENNDHG